MGTLEVGSGEIAGIKCCGGCGPFEEDDLGFKAPSGDRHYYLELVGDERKDRLVALYDRDNPGVEEDTVIHRIAEMAIYLHAVVNMPRTNGVSLPPSSAVDEHWHNAILDTTRYPDLCNALGATSGIINHLPSIVTKYDRVNAAQPVRGTTRDTFALLRVAEYPVDRKLWIPNTPGNVGLVEASNCCGH